MKKLKLLVVANNLPTVQWPEKIERLRQWFAPKVDFSIDVKVSTFGFVPFQPSFENGVGFYRVEDAWYQQNIANPAIVAGYDIVLFVVSWSQWWPNNNAWGYKTISNDGLVHLQIAYDNGRVMYVKNVTGTQDEFGNNTSDAFFEEARHEILHGLFFLTGQADTTHKWINDGNRPEFSLEEIQFPVPREAPLPPNVLDKVFAWLTLMAIWITGGARGAMPSIPPEMLPEPKKAPPEPTPTEPTPVPPKKADLRTFCLAIQKFEDYVLPGGKFRNGAVAPRGSLSFINKNPGNIKWVLGQRLSIGKDARGFAIFATYGDGFAFLEAMVRITVKGGGRLYNSEMTFLEYFKVYAPSSDGNYPENYARFVADMCGVPVSTKMKEIQI